MKKRKVFISTVCIILVAIMLASLVFAAVGSAFAVSQSEIDSLEDQKSEIASQKKSLASQISELESEQAAMIDLKAALDEQNELTAAEIVIINSQIEVYDQLVAIKEVELDEALANEEMHRLRYLARLRAMEEYGDLSYLSILFEATSFADLLSRIDNISEIVEADNRIEEEYRIAREQVVTAKAAYEETLLECETAKAELEAKKAQLELEIEEAYQRINDLEADIQEYEAEFDAYAAEEASLSSQITSMIAELEAQQEAAKKAAAENGTTYTYVVGSGVLKWPVPSATYLKISSPYGWRIHPIFKTNKFHAGIDISASSGTTIVAADDGTVITATYSSSYGNYVVISHGNGMSTLYAHQSKIAVSVGQAVTKGQTIGYVGSTGWSTGPHLHFEVRINGSTTDPMGYL